MEQDARPRPGRLFVYNAGFLNKRINRILSLAGWHVSTGIPGSDDTIGVWGASATAVRGLRMSARTGASILRVEDAFLRSIKTGREGAPPIGLLLDDLGVHFDPKTPSRLEHILSSDPLDDTALLDAARTAVMRLRDADLSKYNSHDPRIAPPPPGYVLVVDQTRDDASVLASGATPDTFREMLAVARIEHPAARIYIKTHPETLAGKRIGYFSSEHKGEGTELLSQPVSPWALLEGATAVYTVSSQLGFEAILAGHRPRVFGAPFYNGWGLSHDENPVARRSRSLTRAQLAAGAMILAPTWYDPCRDQLCSLSQTIDQLEAQVTAFRADRDGYVATGMRLWKRGPLQAMFGGERPVKFADPPSAAAKQAETLSRPLLVWAGKADENLERKTSRASLALLRVEDGFLRSNGLGADLVPPLSLVMDDLGIYYDPSRESRLDRLIAGSDSLRADQLLRAERLRLSLIANNLSKYNTGSRELPSLPDSKKILVPGQVEDDASVKNGCTGAIRTNADLLARTRDENPDAALLYKPHPDVEAGLRRGTIPKKEVDDLADVVLCSIDASIALEIADEVWTMTSAMGFEALLRGISVTCLGMPFYAGWGHTTDFTESPNRRAVTRPSLDALVHAVLIEYPRYRDPVSGLPCPPEVIVERLRDGRGAPRFGLTRGLAKIQGAFAGYAHLWR